MKSVKLWSIEGNSQKLDGGSMFGNAPKAVWEKWVEVDELNRIPLSCRALLVEIDNVKILCETGVGCFFEPKMAARFGIENPDRHVLVESLNQIGIEPSDIQWVILSHLHFDHAGGLLPKYSDIENGNDGLIFENAKFIVGKSAWNRALNPHFRDRASFIPNLCEKLEASGGLKIVESESLAELFPDQIKFRTSEGHTPGQMLTTIVGEKRKVVFCGDLVPGAPWVHLPITMGYDRFPEKLIEEKQQLYTDLTEQNDLLFFTHDTKIAASQFAKNERGKYQMQQPLTHLKAYEL